MSELRRLFDNCRAEMGEEVYQQFLAALRDGTAMEQKPVEQLRKDVKAGFEAITENLRKEPTP